ncbi:hypothetical protein EXIGLDRAFT_770901 [Exidia glandulosa HHB12029]|uniref:DUF6533 domain-containing protein n=1 Tax=Exidia glandulosa HHB12029 TaxID=1314781 RepID=A0A165GCY5_EXIGL|nr:hypothetical protein EXIGLDRAFT_770901 [Exidia glandulosa HHB12029]
MDPEAQLQAAIAPLIVGLGDLQISKYIFCSALTILLWDWCLTVEDERQTIWKRRVNLLQALFYLNRYGAILMTAFNVASFLLPPHLLTDATQEQRYLARPDYETAVSDGWLHISLSAQIAAQWLCASAIVTYRVRALFQSNRLINIGIVVAWAMANTGVITLATLALLPDKVVAELPFGLKVCHSTVDIPLIWTPFIPALVFDMLAFGLAVWKLFNHASSTSRLGVMGGSKSNANIYKVMAFDSAMYFIVMWAATFVNVFIQLPITRDTLRIAWDPMMAVGSALCSRMVLNLKVADAHQVGVED